MQTQSKLVTAAEVGQVLGAEVTKILSWGFVLELDTGEEATMPFGSLKSGTVLSMGQSVQVLVSNVYPQRNFRNKIEVCQA